MTKAQSSMQLVETKTNLNLKQRVRAQLSQRILKLQSNAPKPTEDLVLKQSFGKKTLEQQNDKESSSESLEDDSETESKPNEQRKSKSLEAENSSNTNAVEPQ